MTILIRTSNRPELFRRCLKSIREQTSQANIIVGYDNHEALRYIPNGTEKHFMYSEKEYPFFYDRYCDTLAAFVKDDWFMYVDDDDFLYLPTVLKDLMPYLTDIDRPVICQFLRHGVPKPNRELIRKKEVIEGKIGLPCIVLHSKHKNLVKVDGHKSGDYRFIKNVTEKLDCLYIPIVLVATDRRSFGKME